MRVSVRLWVVWLLAVVGGAATAQPVRADEPVDQGEESGYYLVQGHETFLLDTAVPKRVQLKLLSSPPASPLFHIPQWRPVSPSQDIRQALAQQRFERRAMQAILGHGRWRDLEAARFDLQLHSLEFTQRLWEDPHKQAKVEDAFLSSFLKIVREGVDQRLGLEEKLDRRLDRWRARARERFGFDGVDSDSLGIDVSPRFDVGGDGKIGMKLRATGLSSAIGQRTSLRLHQSLRRDDFGVKLAYQDRDRNVYLEYRRNHKYRGETIQLDVRFSF